MNLDRLGAAVLGLDAWFETMRGPQGYGGPVAHWWQDSLAFTGAGLDWRYEGIIIGYLTLFERTDEDRWLAKARRAGDDLANGQLSTGTFRNSSFEMNPYTGGTPHEAACDLALLRLAEVLQRRSDQAWQRYAQVAEHNLQAFVLGTLWDRNLEYFKNEAGDETFVPNKAATIIEALLAWSTVLNPGLPIDTYVVSALDTILECQVHAVGHHLDGAIDQGRKAGHLSARYFPFYVARCVPALVLGYEATGEMRFLEAARAAMAFVLRERLPDGSFPQVIYANGRRNRDPRWIAGTGDILRAMDSLRPYHTEFPSEPTLVWLLAGLLPGGGCRTAAGDTIDPSGFFRPTHYHEKADVCSSRKLVKDEKPEEPALRPPKGSAPTRDAPLVTVSID